MAITQNNQFTAIDFRYIRDPDLTGATSRGNAMGTSGKLYQIDFDNTQGSSTVAYLKLYDTNLAITEGTTVPDFCFKVPATRRPHLFIRLWLYGQPFGGYNSGNCSRLCPHYPVYLQVRH